MGKRERFRPSLVSRRPIPRVSASPEQLREPAAREGNLSRWFIARRGHKLQRPRNVGFQLFAGHHGIEHAMFEEEFTALKARRELLPDGLFDDAGASEADQRAGFG